MTKAASKPDLKILESADTLAHSAALWLLNCAVEKGGSVSICLSGGSTPKRLYEYLVEPEFISLFPWDRVHWFFGDERCVPHDHADSNFRMVHEAMLKHAPVPEANIHGIPTGESPPDEAATRYERELQTFYASGTLDPNRYLFDVILLGLGPDGHTASLFPQSPALTVRDRWVVATKNPKGDDRITLTFPVIESAAHTAFLISGEEKHAIYQKFSAGRSALPSTQVRATGELVWFLDEAAAGS